MCWACDPQLREWMRAERRRAVWACDTEDEAPPELQPNENEPTKDS